MRIRVFGDSFVSVDDFAQAFVDIAKQHDVKYVKMDESVKAVPSTESEKKIKTSESISA
jgi:hypothetical protein